MKTPVLFTACLIATWLFVVSSASFAGDADADAQQTTAAKYFEAIFTGDVKQADALSDVPFSLDRKRVLKTKEEVAAVHKSIAENKGQRNRPEYTIKKTTDAPKLDVKLFPEYVAFRVTVDGEHIDIYVSGGDMPKAIGFSD